MSTVPTSTATSRAWYVASLRDFRAANPDAILGEIVRNGSFSVLESQRDAWREEIALLQRDLGGFEGSIIFEYSIPRMGRRIDVVLLLRGAVFVLEFKVGADSYDRASINQVWDYALDLKNFHAGSRDLPIIPVLVATEADLPGRLRLVAAADGVYEPIVANAAVLRDVLTEALATQEARNIDAAAWVDAPYQPTPSIVEAARALYAQHSVDAIARSDAGAKNLQVTSQRVEEIIDRAQREQKKCICFVTGVPGAGKTLVGLNVATKRSGEGTARAVYLSGNSALVDVLREALTRDELTRRRAQGEKPRKGSIKERVKAFIQNVHHFRDDALADQVRPPAEHVAIFDEAQRAWDQAMTERFMARKKGITGFARSEPSFLISTMDRHRDWAVIVCLVGGGQEIYSGEAGIQAWVDAIRTEYPQWEMFISPELTDTEYGAGDALQSAVSHPGTTLDPRLHLAVSMRSYRAENVSAFVKAVLDQETTSATEARTALKEKYPIVLARDLQDAKVWIREHARGTERYGIVISSKAFRLKPHALDVRVKVDPVAWFLEDQDDIRSSQFLEDPATEFQVQGLELDWVCVVWDADLRIGSEGWSFHDFRGSKWVNVKQDAGRRYLLNAYRVLLTRARQGMVIVVPQGDEKDATRKPEEYDKIHAYLASLGIPSL